MARTTRYDADTDTYTRVVAKRHFAIRARAVAIAAETSGNEQIASHFTKLGDRYDDAADRDQLAFAVRR